MDEVLRALRILSTISGMKSSPSKIHHLSVAALLLIVIVSVIVRQIIQPIDTNKGIIVASVEYANYNVRIAMIVCCLVMTNRRAYRIEDLVTNLSDLEKKIQNLGFLVDYGGVKRLVRREMFFLSIKIFLQQIPFFLKGEWNLVKFFDYIVFTVPLFFIEVLIVQWITYQLILRANFKTLNSLLKILRYQRCFQIADFNIQNSKKKRPEKREILHTCGLIYDSLCAESENLNWVFAWQILTIIPTLFVNAIFVFFQTCRMFRDQIRFNGGWIIYDFLYFVLFLEVVKPALSVREEADKSIHILHQIEGENDDIVDGLILQTHYQKVEFSACGVFPLDASLIYSTVGAVTTYLIILLQFDL